MPPPACPECDALQTEVQRAAAEVQRLSEQTEPLRKSLEASFKPYVEALQHAQEKLMQLEAEHAAWVTACANMVADIAKMTGSGAFAVAGYNPADVSPQPHDGWIELQMGTSTFWFRNQEAVTAFSRASGLADSLGALARAQATRDALLQRVIDAGNDVSKAIDDLDNAESRANQRMQQHYQDIADKDAERQHWLDLWNRCMQQCQHGAVEDQRVGLVAIAMMVAGLMLVAIGNPFGLGNAAAAPAGATPSASATTTALAAGPALTPNAQVGPIVARFDQRAFTTHYSVPMNVEGSTPFTVEWRGADCGNYAQESPTGWFWFHPHPPCDPSTDHKDRTIVATVTVDKTAYECRYQGADSGSGPACTLTGKSVPTATATTTSGGGTSTPRPTTSATASATAPATGGGGGSAPTAQPTGSATAAVGGSTQARTPTPTATPTVTTPPNAPTSNPGATAAGAGLVAAGGAAAGYATSRRRNSGTTSAPDDGTGTPPTEPPPPPPLTQPKVTVEIGGQSTTSLTQEGAFKVVVETPRPASGDPPETIDVTLRSTETGKTETVRLRWNGSVRGNVRYESNPLTLDRGGVGGGKANVLGLEFSTGDMHRGLSGTPNGTDIVVSTPGGTDAHVTAYTTWVQQGVGLTQAAIRQYHQFWINVAQQIRGLPDSEGKRDLLRRAEMAIRLAGEATRVANSDWLDTRKLTHLQAVLSLMQGGLTHDPRDEYQYWRNAEEAAHTMTQDIFWHGIAQATIGLYKTVADVSGAGAAWTLFAGRTIMNEHAGWDERLFAALDLAGRLTIFGQVEGAIGGTLDRMAMGEVRVAATEAKALTAAEQEALNARRAEEAVASAAYADRQAANRAAQGLVPPPAAAAGTAEHVGTEARDAFNAIKNDPNATQAAKDAAASAAYNERQAANRNIRNLIPDNPNTTGPSGKALLGADGGTPVNFTEDFGLLRNRARNFQAVSEQYGVRIRVRPANVESLETMSRGYPPKHVKIKSKTINAIDEVIGAPRDSQGLVGYFEPKLPPRPAGMTDATWDKVLRRFDQRMEEFRDQAKAMKELEEKGLVTVKDGRVIDTGLSNTRLKDGHLEAIPGTAEGGTGNPFTGDHDMWDITRADGSPLDAATKAKVEASLMDGSARTQHGPHKDWRPQTDVDRGIDQRIRDSHRGVEGADGVVRPADTPIVGEWGDPETIRGEALVEFSPGQQPVVSYETGAR